MASRPRFINGAIYHVYNRGVDKRTVFEEEKDYFRFVHDLYEFNDKNAVLNFGYSIGGGASAFLHIDENRKRERIVDILAWVLMPNHYHLLLRQKKDAGVSLFMKKLGGGYTRYFNDKYKRSGALFQGKYGLKTVDKNESYLRHLMLYIHLNPVDIWFPGWKADGLKSPVLAENELLGYRWSSYLDYIGAKNFPSVLNLDFAEEVNLAMGENHKKDITEWLKDSEDISDFERYQL